jgi:hypothetical protein
MHFLRGRFNNIQEIEAGEGVKNPRDFWGLKRHIYCLSFLFFLFTNYWWQYFFINLLIWMFLHSINHNIKRNGFRINWNYSSIIAGNRSVKIFVFIGMLSKIEKKFRYMILRKEKGERNKQMKYRKMTK